jgi:hypothetical protein
MLQIPGTSRLAHLQEDVAAAGIHAIGCGIQGTGPRSTVDLIAPWTEDPRIRHSKVLSAMIPDQGLRKTRAQRYGLRSALSVSPGSKRRDAGGIFYWAYVFSIDLQSDAFVARIANSISMIKNIITHCLGLSICGSTELVARIRSRRTRQGEHS